jgi:hypothetical protein
MTELSPFEIIYEILNDGNPKTAKEIAQLARAKGIDWARENANSSLYKMVKNSLVLKIETGKAPLWTLPEFEDDLKLEPVQPKPKIIPVKPKPLPVILEKETVLKVQGLEIHFAFDESLSPSEPYISGDWLENKIFVTVNGNHPFYQSFIDSDEKKKLYIALAAEEVFVQWKVAKQTSKITSSQLLEIRDLAMRDIVLNPN